MTEKDTFKSLKNAIEKTCATKTYHLTEEEALSLGLIKSDESSSWTLAYKFERLMPDGTSITLGFRSFDPSGPFQNLPDVNRFVLRHISSQGGIIEEFTAEYTD